MLQNLQKDLLANPDAHSFDEVFLLFNFISSGVDELFGFSTFVLFPLLSLFFYLKLDNLLQHWKSSVSWPAANNFFPRGLFFIILYGECS